MAGATTAAVAPRTAVRVLRPHELDAATDVLVRGFADDPAVSALVADRALRERLWGLQLRPLVRAGLPAGTVHGAFVGGRLGGVAVWHPPGHGGSGIGDVPRLAVDLVGGALPITRALAATTGTIVRSKPQMVRLYLARRRAVATASAGPAWHLAFLATAPEQRGAGLARLLLERQLQRCDEDGLPAWLETTTPENPGLYERFGFRIVLHVADAGWMPGFWVLRREPS
jgi:GNAT superfamily N-acetyltransferase